jgi:hypothetical protein
MEFQLFNFGESPIRVTDHDGNPWFVAADVCRVLEIQNTTDALSRLDEDERARFNLGVKGETNIISESGLYSLVLTSRKPQARAFKKWITSEVLPAIRKTGSYGHAPLPPATGPAAAFINGIDRLIERGIAPNTAAIQLARVWGRQESTETLEDDTATFHTFLRQHLGDEVAGVAGEHEIVDFTLGAGADFDHFVDVNKMVCRPVSRDFAGGFPLGNGSLQAILAAA